MVLSGHGPQTTIGAERASNPFLAGLAPADGPGHRGLIRVRATLGLALVLPGVTRADVTTERLGKQ